MIVAEETEKIESAVIKGQCICRNRANPIEGLIYISPCCPIHYSLQKFLRITTDIEITDEEIDVWKRRERKRVTYPKMAVAKS